MHENVPDPPWGFVEWAIAGLCGVGVTISGWATYLAWRFGGAQRDLAQVQKDVLAVKDDIKQLGTEFQRRRDETDAEIEKLRENDGKLAQAVAEIPDKLMVRLEPKFNDLTNRLFALVERRNGA